MARRDPFKHHRFPNEVILLAVRWYCRYPLSYRDMRDLLAKRGVTVDAATIYRWVQKFGPEIRKRAYGRHRSWRGMQWHVDETYVRVNGRWCYPLPGRASRSDVPSIRDDQAGISDHFRPSTKTAE